MKGYFMEKLWLPFGGKFIQMDLIISPEAHQVGDRYYHIIRHKGSDLKFLATLETILKMQKDSFQVDLILAP